MSPSRIERRTLIAGALVALAIVIVALSAAIATAEESTTIISAPVAPGTPGASTVVTVPAMPAAPASGTVSAQGGYALDFTLPTFGKSGCLVCHGDANLVVAKGDATQSFWIDEQAYLMSAHKDVVCTGCHIDFGYSSPHTAASGDWRAVAKQSCKNCHQDQYQQWSLSAHAPSPVALGQADPRAASKPLCGDCHGSHYMPVLKNNPKGKAEVHAQAQQMCGRDGCHADYWANFNDYYHGAAYKKGADDAPACWTCHGTHAILKSSDRTAPMNTANLGGENACGTKGCHQGAGPAYASYAPMIHGRDKIVSANPLVKFLAIVFNRK